MFRPPRNSPSQRGVTLNPRDKDTLVDDDIGTRNVIGPALEAAFRDTTSTPSCTDGRTTVCFRRFRVY